MNDPLLRLLKLIDAVPLVGGQIDTASVAFHRLHENWNYDAGSNGERWILQTLGKLGRLGTAFDVGANRGDWASLALEANPGASIHCFEVCEAAYGNLARRFATDERLCLNDVGLADAAGEIDINYYCDNDEMTSMFQIHPVETTTTVQGRVVHGIDYCASHGISHIDFLKMDTEGAEHLVLRGFDDMVTPARIPVVQFEYGVVNIVTKFLLRDFYEYFSDRGYRVGKLFPTSVRFREYRFEDEDFVGPNYVAASPDVARCLGS